MGVEESLGVLRGTTDLHESVEFFVFLLGLTEERRHLLGGGEMKRDGGRTPGSYEEPWMSASAPDCR